MSRRRSLFTQKGTALCWKLRQTAGRNVFLTKTEEGAFLFGILGEDTNGNKCTVWTKLGDFEIENILDAFEEALDLE